MPQLPHLHPGDLAGIGRLAIDATLGVTDIVEALHHAIARRTAPLGSMPEGRTRGLTGLVYGGIRGVTRGVGAVVGGGLDLAGKLLLDAGPSSAQRDVLVAALNGVLGDHLEQTGNPLAIRMQLRRAGQLLQPRTLQRPGRRLLVQVHGLCMNDRHWNRDGHDHGAVLAAEFGLQAVQLHYNSGLHVSTNGRLFAERLEALLHEWPEPVEQLVLLGHSMGGLLIRSACYQAEAAGMQWPRRLAALLFLGTPHHGAPLERGGHGLDLLLGASPYLRPFARPGQLRSAGITDLRHGYLLDADWHEENRFARRTRPRPAPPALPVGVPVYAIAASAGVDGSSLKERLLGDGLVPVASALGRHEDPAFDLGLAEERCAVLYGIDHFGLLGEGEVAERLRGWLGPVLGEGGTV